ncbi:MAG TPA: hypothetical protein DEG12_08650 [Alistipes sp.]|nr:hypothetical protein [Alistipes sp.]HBW12069.1 hypothetical protein [Alistipes sp.]HCF09293.1 hypothetical protein [Alistipes sp.]
MSDAAAKGCPDWWRCRCGGLGFPLIARLAGLASSRDRGIVSSARLNFQTGGAFFAKNRCVIKNRMIYL